MKLELTLQQSAETPGGRRATAWFFSGSSTARWLEQMTRCGWAEPGTRLFVVPQSVSDRTPAGLLVIPEGTSRTAAAESVSSPGAGESAPAFGAGLACCAVAENFYIPVDARLCPAVTDVEARGICGGNVTFFHPALGCSTFGQDQMLRVWDLLELPEERAELWNTARAGDAPLPALQAIVLVQPPTVDDVFGDAGASIGKEPLADLPPAPQEPKQDPLSSSKRGMKKFMADKIQKLLKGLPRKASKRTWLNELEDWAARQTRGAREQMERLRHKELHRLLHLLQNDPEAGLRHAIPMNQFAHRGIAPPSAQLGQHPIDFDPSRLGGRAADFWAVPPDIQAQLRRMYREMAGREMRLGRYRRAAYIYAELLGDLAAAANVLKQGSLFREAALLYEEHLRQPREAAKCLAEGGLLTEAVERYEKLGLWLEAADLYERLGERAGRDAALQRIVNQRLAQKDILGAAQLLDERLGQPDEAIALLRNAWPGSPQAAACLARLFALYSRLGRHDAALEQVAQLHRERVSALLVPPLVTLLGEQALHYPDARLRHRAADLSRVLISGLLQSATLPGDQLARALFALQELAPDDRLLARDANRQLSAFREAEGRRRRVLPPPKTGRAPVVLRRFQLPRPQRPPPPHGPGPGWLAVRAEGPWFFVLGMAPSRLLLLLRGVWEGDFQSHLWARDDSFSPDDIVFEPSAENGSRFYLAVGRQPLAEKIFPANDRFYNQECRVGTPTWLPDGARPFVLGEDAAWSAQIVNGQAVLSCYALNGTLLHTIEITADLLEGSTRSPKARLCLAMVGSQVAVGLGNRLLLTRSAQPPERFELAGEVVRLCSTLRHTRPGVVAVLEHGAHLFWRGQANGIELERDLPAPACAFIPGGPIVLAAANAGLLLDVDGRGVSCQTRFQPDCKDVVAVSHTNRLGQFALFDRSGEVVVYQIPT